VRQTALFATVFTAHSAVAEAAGHCPLLHSIHASEPNADAYPASQFPRPLQALCAGGAGGVCAGSAQYCPVGICVLQLVCALALVQYPLPHAVHCVLPDEGLKYPPVHASHFPLLIPALPSYPALQLHAAMLVDPATDVEPVAQGSQVSTPSVAPNVFAEHSGQA